MIKILITGDFCPHRNIQELTIQGKYNKVFSAFTSHFQDNNLNITNLECPLYDFDTRIKKIGSNLKASTSTVNLLKYARINLVTLANNHIMDHGPDGLKSTLEICKSNGIDTVGAGMNYNDARKPVYLKIENKIIAFISIAENEFSTTKGLRAGANGLNPVNNYYDITEAKNKSDILFVIIHGGREHYEHPTPRVVETYRYFVDIGADAVIGHHTHCYQGFEVYKGSPIFYSLGNFIFPPFSKHDPESWYSGYCVKFFIDIDSVNFEIIPYKQGVEDAVIRNLSSQERIEFDNKLNKMNEILSDDLLIYKKFEEYCITQTDDYKSFFEPYNDRYTRYLFRKGFLPSFIIKPKGRLIYDMINCEAHREIFLKILELEGLS